MKEIEAYITIESGSPTSMLGFPCKITIANIVIVLNADGTVTGDTDSLLALMPEMKSFNGAKSMCIWLLAKEFARKKREEQFVTLVNQILTIDEAVTSMYAEMNIMEKNVATMHNQTIEIYDRIMAAKHEFEELFNKTAEILGKGKPNEQ